MVLSISHFHGLLVLGMLSRLSMISVAQTTTPVPRVSQDGVAISEFEKTPRTPNCPAGYVDHTFGEAFWWACVGLTCPGQEPWADRNCGCACVTQTKFESIMATTSTLEGSTTSMANDAPADSNPWATQSTQQPGTGVPTTSGAPGSATTPLESASDANPWASGPADGSPAASPSGDVANPPTLPLNSQPSAATTPMPATAATKFMQPAGSGEDKNRQLWDHVTIALVIVGAVGVLLCGFVALATGCGPCALSQKDRAAFAVYDCEKQMFHWKRASARVHPMPGGVCNVTMSPMTGGLPVGAWTPSCVTTNRLEEQVSQQQLPTLLVCPDVSNLGRCQKAAVLNGGLQVPGSPRPSTGSTQSPRSVSPSVHSSPRLATPSPRLARSPQSSPRNPDIGVAQSSPGPSRSAHSSPGMSQASPRPRAGSACDSPRPGKAQASLCPVSGSSMMARRSGTPRMESPRPVSGSAHSSLRLGAGGSQLSPRPIPASVPSTRRASY